MQQIADFPYYTRKNTPRRFGSAMLSICGGLALTLLLGRCIETAAEGWSPTETARRCFRYPEEPLAIDSEAVGQYLLSAAFFGSDALYFDAGEENTGIEDLSIVTPSDMAGEEAPQEPLGEPSGQIRESADIYAYDRSALPQGVLALLPYDLSGGAAAGEVLLSNTTAYAPDIDKLLTLPYPIQTDLSTLSEKAPLVLILHTHGTEAFSPEGASYVSPTTVHRSSDINENIVAVGAVMAQELNKAGIPTIHCEIMHDLESYQRSYNLAADTIQKYLTEYPSIRYVFDVHRDAIIRTSGDLIRPITQIDGELSAQIMLLVGTNEKGADHPDWETNLSIAVQLQQRLTSAYDRFARPINIRGASFNEQFTPGSLLIEIGSAGNTLSEAKAAAKYLTYTIADMILENAK